LVLEDSETRIALMCQVLESLPGKFAVQLFNESNNCKDPRYQNRTH
jgi:hypothetical protein